MGLVVDNCTKCNECFDTPDLWHHCFYGMSGDWLHEKRKLALEDNTND